ncbi:6-phosphogluconate dehydrogenase [Paenibacillus sp. J31TS4]|uniref:prephenate dehydrogenase/arogenate dehydrogenase family protein n=1 Tax=Paenibacillus sp. J31TS4 TaxID=2807195 RepID=UPI001B046D42|nr:prephenate dehydrogenase/arogenate dehydrogenase family protein [Paenibacillus sp. J31TS4]GIP37908.1 6-phosphogluconate dehydrogenase [Paenibacillus sp. J31TS4]
MQLGFIGFGEAAFEMSSGLKEQGFGTILAYDSMWNHPVFGSLVKERASKAKVELKTESEGVLDQADILIVAVPADKAYEVSGTLTPHLKKGCIYVDVSASNPEIKRKISGNVKKKEVSFVDAAMMGPLPVYRHKVPILASGDGTDALIRHMSSYGMEISKVSENPGDASAVKLIRSIYMKGTAALLIEMLEAAHRFQVEDLVVGSISETMDGKSFEQSMNRLVTGTSVHAVRRATELEGSIQMLEAAGLDSLMSQAARDKLRLLSDFNLKEKFEGKTPAKWLDVITAMQGQ